MLLPKNSSDKAQPCARCGHKNKSNTEMCRDIKAEFLGADNLNFLTRKQRVENFIYLFAQLLFVALGVYCRELKSRERSDSVRPP